MELGRSVLGSRAWLGISMVLVLGPLAASGLAQSGSGPVLDSARLSYEQGSSATGTTVGTCEGRAIVFPPHVPTTLRIFARSATLRVYETWINWTVLGPDSDNPSRLMVDGDQSERVVPLPDGPIEVGLGPEGRAVAYELGAFDRSEGPFQVQFETEGFHSGPNVNGHDTGYYWYKLGEEIVSMPGGPGGWGRDVGFGPGTARVEGNLTFALDGATVRAGAVEESIPPWKGEATRTPTPFVAVWMERYHHALLDLAWSGFEADPSGLRAVCGTLWGDVDGSLTTYVAQGHVTAGDQGLDFENRELTLSGAFTFFETPQELDPRRYQQAPVDFSSRGRFEAVGLDFQPVLVAPDGGGGVGLAVVAAAATAGLALLVWKVAAWLFTRLRRDALLEAPVRRRLHDAIRANPGVSLKALVQGERVSETNARYHLGVLGRHGRIRAFKVQGQWRFALAQEDAHQLRRRVILERDRPLQSLLQHVDPDGTRALHLVRALQAEFGMSKAGGWKVIQRAVATGFVLRETSGRGVVLRRVT